MLAREAFNSDLCLIEREVLRAGVNPDVERRGTRFDLHEERFIRHRAATVSV